MSEKALSAQTAVNQYRYGKRQRVLRNVEHDSTSARSRRELADRRHNDDWNHRRPMRNDEDAREIRDEGN